MGYPLSTTTSDTLSTTTSSTYGLCPLDTLHILGTTLV
jgi:hypothetical protein